MTTFVTRKTARDALVVLFTATNQWESVYGYMPDTFEGKASVLTIRSGGTQQTMASFTVNPTSYTYVFKSLVLTDDHTGNWEDTDAEDKLDDLDRVFRQTIRDNQAGFAGGDWMNFQPGQSNTGFVIVDGDTYRTEEWSVLVRFATGG